MNNKKTSINKKCVSCYEDIKSGAELCHHCGSFQNWRRFFIHTNTTLALIVALVSVISMAVPLIFQAIKPDNSELSIAYVDRSDVMVPVIASNKGTRLAVMNSLAGMKLKIIDKNKIPKTYVLFYVSMTDNQPLIANRDSLVILENQSKIFYYQLDFSNEYNHKNLKEMSTQNLNITNIDKCEFIAGYTNFDGTSGKKSLIIFDKSKIQISKLSKDEKFFQEYSGATGCLIKIPDPLRKQYMLF